MQLREGIRAANIALKVKGFPVRESSKQPDPFFVQLATCVGDTVAWCRLIAGPNEQLCVDPTFVVNGRGACNLQVRKLPEESVCMFVT